MNPCFWLIRPPRAADGPIGGELWARLAGRLLLLVALYLAAMLLARH
jgi:hypothetical protein